MTEKLDLNIINTQIKNIFASIKWTSGRHYVVPWSYKVISNRFYTKLNQTSSLSQFPHK